MKNLAFELKMTEAMNGGHIVRITIADLDGDVVGKVKSVGATYSILVDNRKPHEIIADRDIRKLVFKS